MVTNIKQTSGFTLIELLIVVVILGIMLAMAAPNFQEWTANNRSTAVREDLMATLIFARSEAVKSAKPVSVCLSTDGESCDDDGDVTDWRGGMIVYKEVQVTTTDEDTGTESTTTELDILRVIPRYPGKDSNVSITASGTKKIRFEPSGMAGAQTVFSVKTEGCTGSNASNVTVKLSGSTSKSAVGC